MVEVIAGLALLSLSYGIRGAGTFRQWRINARAHVSLSAGEAAAAEAFQHSMEALSMHTGRSKASNFLCRIGGDSRRSMSEHVERSQYSRLNHTLVIDPSKM